MQDALDEIARQKPRDVFKPLRVHFIGEDGIDAGGVKKEFFQLLVTELLCPDYGMLIFQPVRTSPSSLPPPLPCSSSAPPPLACPSLLLPFSSLVSSSLRSTPLFACAMPLFDSLCMDICGARNVVHSVFGRYALCRRLYCLLSGLELRLCTCAWPWVLQSPVADLVRCQTQPIQAHT